MENIGIYCILFFSLLAIHGVFADPTLCNAADTDLCTTCCIGTDPAAECITDILKCPLNPNTDFSVLVTILIIICAFIIGIPLFLYIVDKLLCSALFNCKMSLCECMATYICCWCCISREKPPQEFDDADELENLESQKKKPQVKVAPDTKE